MIFIIFFVFNLVFFIELKTREGRLVQIVHLHIRASHKLTDIGTRAQNFNFVNFLTTFLFDKWSFPTDDSINIWNANYNTWTFKLYKSSEFQSAISDRSSPASIIMICYVQKSICISPSERPLFFFQTLQLFNLILPFFELLQFFVSKWQNLNSPFVIWFLKQFWISWSCYPCLITWLL